MYQMNVAAASNNASSSHTAVETLNSQGLVRQYSGFSSTYRVVVNPISPSLVSRQEDSDDTYAFEVTTTLLPSPLTPVTPQRLASSTTCAVANLVILPFLQTASPQLAAGNVELRPSLRPISVILPSVPSFQPSSCTNFVPDTPLPNQISQIGQFPSSFQPRALRRLLPKVTAESVKPSVSTENAYSYKGPEGSGVHCNSNSSPMCKTSSFSHLGGPATCCQTSSSTSIAARASVKVPASVNAVAGANIEVTSNLMLPTKAKETSPSSVEKVNKDILVCSGEKHAMHMQPSAVQTKVSQLSTVSQSSDSYSAPKPNGSPVHCTVNNSTHGFHAIEPHTSTSTQDSTGLLDGENESLSNYRLLGKEARSLCIDDSVSSEHDSLEKEACFSTASQNPAQVAIEKENLPSLDCYDRSKKGDWPLHVDSATDHSGHQFVNTVLDVRNGCSTLNSGEPVRNFKTLVTCGTSEKNETDYFHDAVNDSKCHFNESVLDACNMTSVSAGMAVGNENSQAHGSCSALERNSWAQVRDCAVPSLSNQSHGARLDTHINSHDSASIAVDKNALVQEKELCHLVWQDDDIDSAERFSFTDIGCEQEKAEVQGEANSKGCSTLNSGEPVRNFKTLVTCGTSEKNETDHFHDAVNDSKCHFNESVLDACIMTNVSAGMTVGNENSQAHGSYSALEKNSWSEVSDHAVPSLSNQSHGARLDTHINSHDSASIAVDKNAPVQEKEVCHLVWQDNDIESAEVFSFADIGCEQEKAEVHGEANSCSDNLKLVDSNRQPESKGAKSSFVRRIQPARACKCLHSSASNTTAVLEQNPHKAKKRDISHLTISVPNCIGRPCIVVMGRLNDKVIKSGHVNLTTVKEETLFLRSRSPEVKLFPGKIISVASCATLQDIYDQPSNESAEQTQGDDLSKLLEERRAYMSQVHSVFHTTDHSSM